MRTLETMQNAMLYVCLEQFTAGSNSGFTCYVDRIKTYLHANGLTFTLLAGWMPALNRHPMLRSRTLEHQCDIFLTVLGSTCFNRLVELVVPCLPTDVPLDKMVDLLKAHYDPKPSKRVQRFHFNNKVQGQNILLNCIIWHNTANLVLSWMTCHMTDWLMGC